VNAITAVTFDPVSCIKGKAGQKGAVCGYPLHGRLPTETSAMRIPPPSLPLMSSKQTRCSNLSRRRKESGWHTCWTLI
jgi:hypothetical protein